MKITSQNDIWTKATKELNGKTYDIAIKRIREEGQDGIFRPKISVWVRLNGERVHDAQVELAIFKEVCERFNIFLNPPREIITSGTIEGPNRFIEVLQHKDAWTSAKTIIDGATYYISVKHFEQPSKFGIRNGRISKLWIREEGTIIPCVNYDRGWDIRPKTEAAKTIYKEIVKMYN